jgi:hypothetical protein
MFGRDFYLQAGWPFTTPVVAHVLGDLHRVGTAATMQAERVAGDLRDAQEAVIE